MSPPILLSPPPPARSSRQSPRSVTALTSPTAPQKKELEEVEEDSFLAGFSPLLKFSYDDDDGWTHPGSTNPFREAKRAAERATPILSNRKVIDGTTPAAAAPTTSSSPAPTAATTYQFGDYFESNDPFAGPAPSDYHVSEAITVVSPELLSPPKKVVAAEPVSPPKKVSSAPEIHSIFVTPENSPSRQSKRDKVEEKLRQRRSSSHGKKEDRTSRARSSNASEEEEGSLPTREDESTLCDTATYETNSLTYRDNATYFTEDDSLTLRDGDSLRRGKYNDDDDDDDDTFLTPMPASRRSRYSQRGGVRLFLCGCEDNDGVADTMKDLRGAFKDINRTMRQILSPMSNARKYVVKKAKSQYDSVREQTKYY